MEIFNPNRREMNKNNKKPIICPKNDIEPIHDISLTVIGRPSASGELSEFNNNIAGEHQAKNVPYPNEDKFTIT